MKTPQQITDLIQQAFLQVESNVDAIERNGPEDDIDVGTVSSASVIADRKKCETEEEVAFYDGGLAADMAGLSPLDQLISAFAHMMEKQGLSTVEFYTFLKDSIPADHMLAEINNAQNRLREKQLWPWSDEPSRAKQIVTEAGYEPHPER